MAQTHVSTGTTTAAPDKRRMSQSQEPALPRKRRRTEEDPSKTADKPSKNPATTETPSMASLSSVQEAVLEDLKPKYDVLPAFTISATKVAKRNVRILEHLRKDNGDPRPRVVYLHARPSDANKMITIVEQVKRELAKQGKTGGGGQWFQYNMLYELPPSLGAKKAGSSTATKDAEDKLEPASDDDDDFERMESRHRLDKAVDAEPVQKAQMSLGIFLAQVPISELKGRVDVTTQSNAVEVAA
ncbi:hypothetical protein F5X68DRAFT_203355 [Plectosphaerella plurivora]|uniref:DNA/RNA-binding protein Alba-like domain-containing protein n=1 Tax=Plectosphaerella plurivora TaxID=936078 RepID=A0A9P9AEY6_9PEZI|nr:hypothetical protein F5X68DRAFT_203355 [Plectosphaerella plurivora]